MGYKENKAFPIKRPSYAPARNAILKKIKHYKCKRGRVDRSVPRKVSATQQRTRKWTDRNAVTALQASQVERRPRRLRRRFYLYSRAAHSRGRWHTRRRETFLVRVAVRAKPRLNERNSRLMSSSHPRAS